MSARVGWWRYLPPNLVTASSLVLAALATFLAIDGRPVHAAWIGLLCMLSDKLDGLLAGALRASSEFGVQLDSLADLAAFGMVPSVVYYSYFHARPDLGWADGLGRVALIALCAFHLVAVAVRLARFNVQAAHGPAPHYFGIPSTMTAGTLLALFLFVLKYSAASLSAPEAVEGWGWFGPLRLDALLRLLPLAFGLGALAMLSGFRVPRLKSTPSRLLDVLLVIGLVLGVLVFILEREPEYVVAGALLYFIACVVHHVRTRAQRRGV